MQKFEIDPFESLRKNGHIWEGEKATLWYHEKLDGSFTLIVLYDFEDKKRRLHLEINNFKRKIEFKNEDISEDLYNQIQMEIESYKGFAGL
ncbi:hypothetical protein K2X05_08085 [bacterium]|jgi:hypothetical protein|nr:hypothetical protein [bacterium]